VNGFVKAHFYGVFTEITDKLLLKGKGRKGRTNETKGKGRNKGLWENEREEENEGENEGENESVMEREKVMGKRMGRG
jgi:hypothetical protein